MFFIKLKNKVSLIVKAWTSSKLGWYDGKTANSNIFVTQKIWPRQVRRQLNWSSRVGEISIFNILKETSQQNNVGSQLQFFKDVSCENVVFYCSSTDFFLVFQSILGRLECTGRLPRTAWNQIGNIELKGPIQGYPGTLPGGQKRTKNIGKTMVFDDCQKQKVFRCERVNIFKTELTCR